MRFSVRQTPHWYLGGGVGWALKHKQLPHNQRRVDGVQQALDRALTETNVLFRYLPYVTTAFTSNL